MRKQMRSITQKCGLAAAILVLLALSMPSIVSATSNILYVVRVDLTSAPPRALNAATGQPMSNADVQVVNPEDEHTYELQAKNMSGQDTPVWVVEQNMSTGTPVWSASVVTTTKAYQPWINGKIRGWVQANEETACATAESLSGGTFVCPDEEQIVEGLYRLDGAGLEFYSNANQPQTVLILATNSDQFPSVGIRTDWTPDWEDGNPIFTVSMPDHTVYIGISSAITASVSEGMTRAGWHAELEWDQIGVWFWKDGHRPNEDLDRPQPRQVECRFIETLGIVAVDLGSVGQGPVSMSDLRLVNTDGRESQLTGSPWIVGLEIDDTQSPPMRRVSINKLNGENPIYGVSEVQPGAFQGTRVWCALDEADANAEAWRLMEANDLLSHMYLPAVQR